MTPDKTTYFHTDSSNWLQMGLDAIEFQGFFILEGVFAASFLQETRERMYDVQGRIHSKIGLKKLEAAGEKGVLRLMMAYDPFFTQFLETPEILSVVDRYLSPTAILHLQNGFILPSEETTSESKIFQNTFHQDFRRTLNGYRASLNAMVTIDPFSEENGATYVVPGTQLKERQPSLEFMERIRQPVICEAGAVVFFDSTLWHAAGRNTSGKDRLAINHQFTMSYFKQQIDYPIALGPHFFASLETRTQQVLGWYTRVPASAEEYYVPAEHRTYLPDQG